MERMNMDDFFNAPMESMGLRNMDSFFDQSPPPAAARSLAPCTKPGEPMTPDSMPPLFWRHASPSAFNRTAPRMSGSRTVPVQIVGSTSNLSVPRPSDGRQSASPSTPRKFDSLPRQMPSQQQQQQRQQHNASPQPAPPTSQPQPQPQPQSQSQPQQQQQQQQHQANSVPASYSRAPDNSKPTVPISPAPQTPPKRNAAMQRKTSVEDFNEKIVNTLDDVERRVELFRETASQLEAEKETILEMLTSVNLNTELLRLGEGEREDINAVTNRLLARTKTVDIVVNTPRNPEQAKALDSVNSLIETVMSKLREDLDNGIETCRRYLNACSPDQPEGPIDQRFQAQIIECTADDQKKIRRRLAQLIQQIERAERTCFPEY